MMVYEGHKLYSGAIPSFEEISVDFDDGIFESLEQKLAFYSKAKTAQLVPTTEALKGIFNLTDEEAIKWFQRIQQEEYGLDPKEVEEFLTKKELGDEE